jgi:YidC/Oxa1 family membrane protein insertase
MEQKKLDVNSLVGFGLIFLILVWVLYNSQQKEAAEQIKKAEQEQVEAVTTAAQVKTGVISPPQAQVVVSDSLQTLRMQSSLGSFAYSAALPSAKESFTVLENELVRLKIANKGGYIVEAELKQYEQFRKNSGQKVHLIKDGNADFNIELKTADNRSLNTKELFFEPVLTKEGANQVLTMRLKAGAANYLEYRYVMKPNDYMLDFAIRSQGLNTVLNTSNPLNLDWSLKSYRNEKSVTYENRYTELIFEYEEGKDNYLGQSSTESNEPADVTYIAFKQHFFTSVLLTNTPFEKAIVVTENLVKDEEVDTVFTKQFKALLPLAFKNGEVNYNMNWYYGPTDYRVLDAYDKNLDEIVPLGWGIFGWINRYIFIPTFDLLIDFFPYGLAIIFLTILVRIVMSPFTYKSYLSQAKMKILRPEIQELTTKFGKDPMKKQQETMKLYSKAGVNPMAGCLPAVMQIPVFYALFSFFPSAIDLRQKSFLWANDLSSFDAVINLPFYIPFYGNHVSLFPILASIAIFFYMKMTTGDQAMTAPPQDGMPDMAKIMKIMIYLSPLMMLFFFNNFASGLSLYYFISNVITIGIMLVIKKYIIDENKIQARIQENKTKPKTMNRFQRKMQEMMEEVEKQKNAKKK